MDESEIWSPESRGIYLSKRQVKFVLAGEFVLLFVAFALGAGWAAAAFGFNFF